MRETGQSFLHAAGRIDDRVVAGREHRRDLKGQPSESRGDQQDHALRAQRVEVAFADGAGEIDLSAEPRLPPASPGGLGFGGVTRGVEPIRKGDQRRIAVVGSRPRAALATRS